MLAEAAQFRGADAKSTVRKSTISLILPTWRAARFLPELLAALQAQTTPPEEILVIDSSSPDDTAAIARRAGCQVTIVAQASFNHGQTRNDGALQARGDILVFMTQDALPAGADFLEKLTAPVVRATAAAAFARQLPRPGASPPERFQRLFQYPERQERTPGGAAGVEFSFFCSNAALAVDRSIFFSVGGFPPRVPCSEDAALSAKLQRAGWKMAYQPGAAVIHSHGLRLPAQFRRYFDVGAAYALAGDLLGSARPGGDGRRYAVQLLRYLNRDRHRQWIAFACAELGVKWTGYHLGRLHRVLPLPLKRQFSLQPAVWGMLESQPWQADDPRIVARAKSERAGAG